MAIRKTPSSSKLSWLTVLNIILCISICSSRPLPPSMKDCPQLKGRNTVEITLVLHDVVEMKNPTKLVYVMLPKGTVPPSGPSPRHNFAATLDDQGN
ncbi:hypothetical protein SUGI_0807400 [Cryptomeria japonica]|nr:hypothetical protein SUGI_0807400 [Cryptomeria japonica]